jgi:putative MATE family efflux protein
MKAQLSSNKDFLSNLLRLAVPITAQELVNASLNFTAVLIIGQLGEVPVAAVGLANQIFFLLALMLFGVSSGSAIFTAQFWGKRQVERIHRVQGLNLLIGITGALVVAIGAVFFPAQLLSFYTSDPRVIALGSEYLRIVGLSYVATAVTYSFTSVLRSTGNVRLPLIISATALTFSTVLGYSLIFGRFGLPELGVKGAAVATCLARYLECAAIVFLAYRLKTPAAASRKHLLSFDLEFSKRYLKTTLPVVVNEITWSFGITTYNAIYAHVGTESIAAVNIMNTLEHIAFSFFIGLSAACAILIGNRIGEGEEETAYQYGRKVLALGVTLAVLAGGIMYLVAEPVLGLYNLSPAAYSYALGLRKVLSSVLWVKVSNLILFIGILRSGGDTRYAFIVDTGSIWLIGVPMAYLAAFGLHFPIYLVVLMATAEEFVKFGLVLSRFFSKKWIHNFTVQPAPAEL